jgi:hypothetical protein
MSEKPATVGVPALPVIRAAFDRFKAAYPQRPENGWAPARVAFEKLAKAGVDMDMLVRSASAYAAFTAANVADPKFIPMAKKWLGERRFEDFQEEAPASAAQPSPEPPPEHPFAWAQGKVPDRAWASWFRQLDVEPGQPVTVIAPNLFALNHIKGEYGPLIRSHFGPVTWAIKKKA